MVTFSIDSLLKTSEGGFRFVKQTFTSKKKMHLCGFLQIKALRVLKFNQHRLMSSVVSIIDYNR